MHTDIDRYSKVMKTSIFMHGDVSNNGCFFFFCQASLLPSIAKLVFRPACNSLQLILTFLPEAYLNNLA